MITDPPVVYRVCSDDLLREQILALETDPWLAERMFERRGETMPDDWSPETEVREWAAAGVRIFSIDASPDDTSDPPWWNLWMTTRVSIALDRKIEAALTAIADESGADVAELWKVYDRLVDIRDPKGKRESDIDRRALAQAAAYIDDGMDFGKAADFTDIPRRKFERYRTRHPLQWEQIQHRVRNVRKRSDK